MSKAPDAAFTGSASQGSFTIKGRICTHEEVLEHFFCGEDMYHYYHLIHLRASNSGYIRYTIQSEGASFFIPPPETFKRYTTASIGGGSIVLSLINAIVFFPIYALSLLKSAVEAPPYLAQSDLVVPKSFATLSLLYAGITLLPLLGGALLARAQSSSARHLMNDHMLMQRQERTIDPFSTEDFCIITPRAGFTSPCQLAIHNHKTHAIEKVSLPLTLVW